MRIFRIGDRAAAQMPKKKATGSKDKAAGTVTGAGLEQIVAAGRKKGYLTFDEVNDLLEEQVTDQAAIESVLELLRESKIEVRETDEKPAAKVPKAKGKKTQGLAELLKFCAKDPVETPATPGDASGAQSCKHVFSQSMFDLFF